MMDVGGRRAFGTTRVGAAASDGEEVGKYDFSEEELAALDREFEVRFWICRIDGLESIRCP